MIIGVTGTSGKSTTSAMVYHILKEQGFRVGLISTVGVIAGEKNIDSGFHVTTPDPIALQKYLKMMVDQGVEYVVLEVSSHALDQGRLGLLKFDFSVFTNIKDDHLDWHKTWENYAGAKFKLVEKLRDTGTLIINKDDRRSYEFIKNKIEATGNRGDGFSLVEYSIEGTISDIKESFSGIDFSFFSENSHLNLIGKYNLSNFLAAAAVAQVLGISNKEISNSIKNFEGLEGRMQVMQNDPFTVIVDFAHNADSLEKSLESIRRIKDEESRVICVFGSAGLRDRQKRFDMGKVSGNMADITIVTAEDPRTESLYEINSKIIEGAEESGGTLVKRFATHEEYLDYLKENGIDSSAQVDSSSVQVIAISSKSIFAFDYPEVQNRMDAIAFAIKLVKPNDIVITEGKGHEKSLAFGTTEYPYTDQAAVQSAL